MKYIFTFFICLASWLVKGQELWTQKQDFPPISGISGRDNYASFAIGDKVYVGMGTASYGISCGSANTHQYKDWYAYDPSNNSWTKVADFPGVFRYNGYVCFSIGNKGYFGLGYSSGYLNDFWEYDPSTNIWTRKADLPVQSSYSVGYSIGNKGYIVGGTTNDPVTNNNIARSTIHYEYDPTTNTWTSKANLPIGLTAAAGFSIASKGYIGIGVGNSGYNNDFFSYDPFTDAWSQIASYPKQSKQSAVGFSLGNLGYVIGGNNGIPTERKDVYAYDPTSDTWILKTSYPGNFVSQNLSGGNRQNVVNNKFYFGLGFISYSQTVCGSYTYSYSCGSWWSSSTCYDTYYYYTYNYVYSNQWWEFGLPINIETGVVDNSICEGDSIDVPYTLDGQVAADNIFTAQLSDASGSFANPVSIGTISSTASGTIKAKLPLTVNGSGYRVRVVSSNPSVNGTDNGSAITINPLPSIDFAINNAEICLEEDIAFTNNTTGADTFTWLTGDGVQDTSQNLQHLYTLPGIYSVKLIATTAMGCTDSLTKTVTVNPKPTAKFSILLSEQCINGNSFAFKNESTTASGTLTYSWQFGDGNSSNSKDPVHVYTQAGMYNVELIVTNESGCSDTVSQTVNVFPKPSPSFTINNASQCFEGNQFIFTNNSTLSLGTMSFKWNFGDGNTSGSQHPQHSYSAAGTYTVKLVVVTDKGCSDSVSQTITVNPQPIADFDAANPTQCVNGNSFAFANKSTITSGTLTYKWNFGDGNTSVQKDPVHVYANAGSYTVQLISISSFGCADTIQKSITIHPKPIVDFNINDPGQCLTGNKIELLNNSSISSGTLTHTWYFGDGKSATGLNTDHSYLTSGVFNVKLVSSSSNGCADSITKQVTIYPQPDARFSINDVNQCLPGNSFIFTNNSTISTGTLNSTWSFGDGNSANSNNASHNYAIHGTYDVKLIVTSNQGCMDSTSETITVNPQPVASFTVNNASQCLSGNSFSFKNSSSIASGNIINQWSFGDGNISSNANPVHQYANPGTYTVRLVVISEKGCSDTLETMVKVNPNPSTSFLVGDNDQCLTGNKFSFTNTTKESGTLSYLWDMGDGNNYISKDVSHSYSAPGIIPVTLTVTNEFGCTQLSSQTVSVNPEPVSAFSVNNSNQCLKDNKYIFTNTSSISSGSMNYEWTFGDGITSTLTNPDHIYSSEGSFTVQLKASTAKGCTAISNSVVTVYGKPTASFTIQDAEQCLDGNIFRMNNTSSNIPGIAYNWIFGDGSSASTTHANKTYQLPGNYTIQLFSKNNAGCVSDTFSRQVIIHSDPTVNAGPDQLVLEGKTITVNPSVTGENLEFLWTPGRFQLSSSTQQQLVIQPVEDVTYTITVTGTGECRSSDQVAIKVLKKPIIPNVFSPNGDGINDVWVIKYLDNYPGATVDVFNRAGQRVYRTQGYSTPWNGTFKGNPLPIGTYYYVIDPKNGREKISGSITILK
jgi:gliding motility-associated-like protein